ncbi:MAG: DinB family protein [Chitinophagaceae bacterium]
MEEFWLRGPINGIPALLMPVAHALLQAREEVSTLMEGFPDKLLWERPSGVASVGFHLQHLAGVADRLFTYAKGEALNSAQLKALASEKEAPHPGCEANELISRFNEQVDNCLEQLKAIEEQSLAEPRVVGRTKLPSTVIGLLVHTAEHTLRHVGQLLVTVRIIKDTQS